MTVAMVTVTAAETPSPLILRVVLAAPCRIVPIDATVCLSYTGLGTLTLRQPTIRLASLDAIVATPPLKKIAIPVRQERATTVFDSMDFPMIQNTNPSRS